MMLSYFCFYPNGVNLFTNALEDTQKLMRVLENFCTYNELNVNNSKNRGHDCEGYKPCNVNNEPLEIVGNFK